CRWEHVMSEQVERKLLKVLGNPVESPYGNPIPGLDELGLERQRPPLRRAVSAPHMLEGADEVRVLIRRLAEPAQVDPELLVQLSDAGVIPGNTATLSRHDGFIRISVDGAEGACELAPEVAAFIFVERA